jgi:ParB-like chromosome segregation protein Spo0J
MGASDIPESVAVHLYGATARPQISFAMQVPLALLDEPLDPMRHSMDDEEMVRLQSDIRQCGLLENLCVVPTMNGVRMEVQNPTAKYFDGFIASGGRFRVAAGHRRLLACRAIRYDPVKCEIFCDTALHEEHIMHSENAHREETTDYDLAVLYSKWIQEPDMTEKELQSRAGKSLSHIYDRANILNGYEDVATALRERKIPFSVAKRLNQWDEPEFVRHWLNMAIDQGARLKIVNGWIDERKAFLALAAPRGPEVAGPLGVTTQKFIKQECLLCGDSQSYNLQTVLMCGSDIERIRAIRANAEAQEGKPDGQA